MKQLQITAFMNTPLSVNDSWSPNLDAILYYFWLKKEGLFQPNVNPDNYIKAEIPLAEIEIDNVSFYKVSSPMYQVKRTQSMRYRKRWDNQDKHIEWGKQKAKIKTAEGHSKNWDLPLRLVETNRIDWFAEGNAMAIEELLADCKHLGKKRSQGKGLVRKWAIKQIQKDKTIVFNEKIMRPIPVSVASHFLQDTSKQKTLYWAYKPPYFLPDNQANCFMPDLIKDY